MRLQHFINEKSYDEYTLEIVDILKKDCRPFLKDFLRIGLFHRFLFRSIDESITYIKRKSVRKDRKPRDTPLDIHKKLDEYFKKKFGIKLRSNSVFTIPNKTLATEYADYVNIMFPIGKYEIYWAPSIRDLTEQYNLFTDSNEIRKYTPEEEKNFYSDIVNEYEKGGLKRALKSDSEIMVYCKEYYLIPIAFRNFLENHLKIEHKDILKEI